MSQIAREVKMANKMGKNQRRLVEFLQDKNGTTFTVKQLAAQLGLNYPIVYQSVVSLAGKGTVVFANGNVSLGSTPTPPAAAN